VNTPRTVLSLGGGVQSSTVLLMACVGELDPLDAVVFSDTGGEAPQTYEYIDYLRAHAERAGIRFLTVSAGDLRADLVARHGRGGQPTLPVKIRHDDGTLGRLSRYRCSYDYKRRPITRAVKALCGPPGTWKQTTVEQWIAYDITELGRVKPADECRCGHKRVRRAIGRLPFEQIHDRHGCRRCGCAGFDPWQINRWPLIELGMTRQDCRDWVARHGFRAAHRSACLWCPNRPASYWPALKRDQPALFAQAVALDEFLRHGINGLRGQAYLHPSARPLAEAVGDLNEEPDDTTAMDCEAGVCFT
jgi:hypothetical protein